MLVFRRISRFQARGELQNYSSQRLPKNSPVHFAPCVAFGAKTHPPTCWSGKGTPASSPTIVAGENQNTKKCKNNSTSESSTSEKYATSSPYKVTLLKALLMRSFASSDPLHDKFRHRPGYRNNCQVDGAYNFLFSGGSGSRDAPWSPWEVFISLRTKVHLDADRPKVGSSRQRRKYADLT